MRLRRKSRFRSFFKTVLSLLIVAGLAVGAAWKFELWPIEFLQPSTGELAESEEGFSMLTDSSEEQSGERAEKSTSQESSEDVSALDSETDSVVFQNQMEPEVDEGVNAAGSRSSLPFSGRSGSQRQEPASLSASSRDPQTDARSFPESPAQSANARAEREEPFSASPPEESSPFQNSRNGDRRSSGIVQTANEVVEKQRTPPKKNSDLSEIDGLLEEGNYVAAHRELSKIYWSQPELRDTIQKRIETTARSIYFDPQPHYMEPYVIQPGDQLRRIARKYQVPWQYLAKLNRTDPRKIRAGQKLKVIQGPFSAFVDLSDLELTVHAHGYFVSRYPVGIGKDGTTPLGKFTVQEKLEDPTYYGPDGVVANDDPQNPLGERWIDLGDSYGIHGTIDPDSIGRAKSRGCIRLRNQDVEEVYDLLTVGSKVVIRR